MKLKLRENADINVVTGISDIIIDSINKKWDNIRDLNSIIVNMNEEGYEEMVPVIQSVLEDENKNVGKLQQLVELISPTAKSIDDGRQEAIDELDNIDEVKVEEEMKLDENFSNVPEETTTVVDPVFGKAIEDKEEDEKVVEDALKENEKLAKETIPKEGETGKKVTSKALKAMHLSEALFDEVLDEKKQARLNSDVYFAISAVFLRYLKKHQMMTRDEWYKAFKHAYDEFFKSSSNFAEASDDEDSTPLGEDLSRGEQQTFNGDVYHALEEVAFQWKDMGVTADDWISALEWFEFHFIDDGEWEEYTEALMEGFEEKKKFFEKKLINFLANKEFKNKFKISDDDKREFISRTLKMIAKYYAKDENVSGEEIADLVNRLFRMSFTKDGNLMTEDKEPSIKMDIAREQLKRFKEGKMPKDWQPKDYLNDLVKKSHLTREEADKLLAEV
jgi:hypothetical protein